MIKILHLESTDVCQAACALCARETDHEFNKSMQHHLSMFDVIQAVGIDAIAELDKMFMCGNYGDPAAGQHTLNIYRQFRKINPNITLGMNTNGALRKSNWWVEIANILNKPKDFVVFSIDGLEDTNHIYRKNVDWSKLMTNAKSFIDAGGNAHWDMLVYKHNEHQVDACQKLAKEMGFKWFKAKLSKRPLVGGLEYPIAWTRTQITQGSIDCQALKEQSIYIDAKGIVHPCCWLGNNISEFATIQSSWITENPNPRCKLFCSNYKNQTNFTNQWQRTIEF